MDYPGADLPNHQGPPFGAGRALRDAGYLADADDAAEAFPTSIAFAARRCARWLRYDAESSLTAGPKLCPLIEVRRESKLSLLTPDDVVFETEQLLITDRA
jgi:hypothetical protein